MGLCLATIFTGSVCNAVCTQYRYWGRERSLHSVLAMGSIPDDASEEELVEPPGATRAVEYILQQQNNYVYYDMIVGNHGTRKTTSVRHVAQQLDSVLHVNTNSCDISDKTFSQELATAFSWIISTRFWPHMLLSYWGINDRKAPCKSSIYDLLAALEQ
ncbi:hypothetical protein HOY80DRAFT_1003025 [Tuber brumale]|nr:hypothetical protein HOY80DRAFT_1003025 [Tuber brumale]